MTDTPLIWKADYVVNIGNLVGVRRDPYIVTLSNGDFLASWSDGTDNVGTSPGLDIIGQRMNDFGEFVGAPAQLNYFMTDSDQRQQVSVGLADGGYLVVYVKDNPYSGPLSRIYFDRYAADGTLVAGGLVAQGELAYADPTAGLLSNGDVIISFGGFNWLKADYSIRGRIFHVADNTMDATQKYEGGLTENGDSPDLVTLASGGFVETFTHSDLTSGSIKYEIRANDGSLVKEAVVVDGENNAFSYVSALNGGGFVVAWASLNSHSEAENVFAKVYDAAGNQVGSKISVATSAHNEMTLDVLGLQDGGFYVAYSDFVTNEIVGQRYDAAGVKVGLANKFTFVDSANPFPYNDLSAELSLTKDGRINLVWDSGNDVHHAIIDPRDAGFTGTESADRYIGTPWADTILGNGGDDTLFGWTGDDIINGGAGTDTLKGGAGNDTYVLTDVHRIFPDIPTKYAYDFVVEDAGAGDDTVQVQKASIFLTTYFLGANIENGVILGTDDFNLAGNELDNRLTGNSGVNVLTGGDGNDRLNGDTGKDTLIGGLGDDTYLLTTVYRIDPLIPTKYAYDTAVEDADSGIDTVIVQRVNIFLGSYTLGSNLENIRIAGTKAFDVSGNELDNQIFGNIGNNVISGLLGADQINGGSGNDTLRGAQGNDELLGSDGDDNINGGVGQDNLYGGTGSDVFVFNVAPGNANADHVFDYSVADDTINLARSVYSALPLGTLQDFQFVIGTGALDGNDRIIYDQDSGALYYDSDGSGGNGKQLIATLSTNLALTAADIVVF